MHKSPYISVSKCYQSYSNYDAQKFEAMGQNLEQNRNSKKSRLLGVPIFAPSLFIFGRNIFSMPGSTLVPKYNESYILFYHPIKNLSGKS